MDYVKLDNERLRIEDRRTIDKERVRQHYAGQQRIAEFYVAMNEIMEIINRMPDDSTLCVPFLAWQFKHHHLHGWQNAIRRRGHRPAQ